VAGDHGGDEQVGGLCGAMSNMERIHAKGARWELCAFY
jgi:hypothetical protein